MALIVSGDESDAVGSADVVDAAVETSPSGVEAIVMVGGGAIPVVG